MCFDDCRLPGASVPLAANSDISGAMHSSVAGDIHVSLARTISKAATIRGTDAARQLDKAHETLLENLEEGDEAEALVPSEDTKGRVRLPLSLWNSLPKPLEPRTGRGLRVCGVGVLFAFLGVVFWIIELGFRTENWSPSSHG